MRTLWKKKETKGMFIITTDIINRNFYSGRYNVKWTSTITKYTRIKSLDPGIDRRYYVCTTQPRKRARDVPSNWQATRLHFWIWHAVHLFAYVPVPASLSLSPSLSLPLSTWYVCMCMPLLSASLNALACFSQTRHRNASWLIPADIPPAPASGEKEDVY